MAEVHKLPPITPEYLAENSFNQAHVVPYLFLVLETITIVSYFASKYIRPPANSREMPYLLVGSYTFSVGICICGILIHERAGSGHHFWILPHHIMVRRLKFLKAFELLYAPAVILPKFAILSLYMKIFATHSKKTRWICYAMGTAMICILIYGLITPLVSCRPFAYNWDRTIPGGSCINIMASYRWTSFPNIITDLILMGICLPAIYRIQLPLMTKLSLLTTFVIGSIGIVTSILRFVQFFRTDLFADVSYNGAQTLIWTTVEPGVYFIAAALLNMRPLFHWVFKETPLSSYVSKITSWKRSSLTKSTVSSGKHVIHKQHDIELKYSTSNQNTEHSISIPEPALIEHTSGCARDGYRRLEEGWDGTITLVPCHQ